MVKNFGLLSAIFFHITLCINKKIKTDYFFNLYVLREGLFMITYFSLLYTCLINLYL